MAINKQNHRYFHRTLYAGTGLQTITLLKRGDNQSQGTVRAVKLFNCRRRQIFKQGQTIARDFTSNQTTTWVIPREQLDANGIADISALDRIVDPIDGGTWQPESGTSIQVKLQGLIVNVSCLRTDDTGGLS